MKSEKFIDLRRLIASKNPTLLKWLPKFILKYLEKTLHQDEINEFIDLHKGIYNEEYCQAIVDFFQIKIEIEGIENIPATGGITIAMNHPLGGMDAMAFVAAIKHHRTDVKIIVNDLLLNLDGLKGMFVGVNKHGKNENSTRTKIDNLFQSDNAVCIFPAGLVSRRTKGVVEDLEWKKTFVLLSKKHKHPIIPVYIDGQLSNFFYNLSNFRKAIGIKANIEMLYLADEFFKQKGRTMKFTVGKPIPAEELTDDVSIRDWAARIKSIVYQLPKSNP